MSDAQITLFAAVLAQIALTIVLYLALVRARFSIAADRSQVKPEMAYHQAAWPLKARLISNSVTSQFELPVLFYVAALFSFEFGAANWISALLAWIFVVMRIVHAIVHTGKNVVMQRFSVFLVGFIALVLWWIYLATRVLLPA